MGVETSILIGTIAGMTLLLTCSILACWYIFFSKDKSFGSAKDQGLQMASKGKIPVENANKPTNHQKRFSMLGQYNQGAANQPGVFQSAYQNLTYQSSQNSSANTPQVRTTRLKRKRTGDAHGGDSVPAHNIFYDTNLHDNTNILDVDMSMENQNEIDLDAKKQYYGNSSNIKF